MQLKPWLYGDGEAILEVADESKIESLRNDISDLVDGFDPISILSNVRMV